MFNLPKLGGPGIFRGQVGVWEGWYRSLTSPIRLLPDILIVGTQKGGTTSLYNYLMTSPYFLPAQTREVHYFDLNYERGPNWYRAHFPLLLSKQSRLAQDKRRRVTGESSPYYLFHPQVPGRIAELLPNVKLIALLRNPVDRAWSHYQHQVRKNRESRTFEAAIAAEAEQLAGDTETKIATADFSSLQYRRFSYLARGIYVYQLKRWYEIFSKEQILILKSEDLFDRPADTVGRTMAFLDLPSLQGGEFRQFNAGGYSPMQAATRQFLAGFFEPHNQYLYEFLGTDFGWEV
jgi:Sulfotransferase domain